MLLVSNTSNVLKYTGSYLPYAIDTQTYLLRKTSKDRLQLPVVNLDKASICSGQTTSYNFWQKRKKFIYIGSFGPLGGSRIWGPNISRSR